MSARQLLDRLKEQGLLDDKVIARLRQQVDKAPKAVSPQAILKTLIDRGLLTKFQAKKLLDEIAAAGPAKAATPPTSAAPPAPPAAEDEELGLADLDDEPAPNAAAASPEVEPIMEVDDELSLDMEEEAPAPSPPIRDRAAPTPHTAHLDSIQQELSPLEASSELSPLPAGPDPLDDALHGGTTESAALGGASSAGAARPSKGYRPPKRKSNVSVWESPFLLIGGGLLVLLLIAGVVLFYNLTRGSAADVLAKAEEEYSRGSYSQAIELYSDFLELDPSSPEASKARVKRALARLRQAVDAGSNDMSPALAVAYQVLDEVKPEEAFAEFGRPELAALLPQIAEQFSIRATQTEDPDQAKAAVAKTEEAMVLVRNPENIPSSFLSSIEARLESIDRNLKDANRNIAQQARLMETTAAIAAAAAAGDTATAYQKRKELLADYPGLERNVLLVEAIQKVSQAQRGLVQVMANSVASKTDERSAEPAERVVLAEPAANGNVDNTQGGLTLVSAGGSVYALDVASGKVRWQRFVGHQSGVFPQMLAGTSGEDALVVDGRSHDLLRVALDDGSLQWRLEVGEPFANPVVAHGKIYIAAQSGTLWEVDPQSGQSARQVKFPMALAVSPSFDTRRPKLYQVGVHSNLFVLSLDTLQCDEVYYLGHKSGSIAASPTMSVGHLFVAENLGGSSSLLHVLRANSDGLELTPALKPPRLQGHVVVDPVLDGRRVVVTTDLGAVHVYDVEPSNAKDPVSDSVEPLVATLASPVVGYSLVDSGNLWIASQRLTLYELQFAQEKLLRKKVLFEKDEFVAPLQLVGQSVISARQRNGATGVTVAAANTRDGEILWETDLAVPSVLLTPSPDGSQIVSVSSNAALCTLEAAQWQAGIQDEYQPSQVRRSIALTDAVPFGTGKWALTSRLLRDRLVIFDPAQSESLQLIPLASGIGSLATCPPVGFLDGLLVPLENGQLHLVRPGQAQSILPFQPRVEAGAKMAWRRPAVMDDQQAFLVTDGENKLYRVGIEENPRPHLQQQAVTELKDPIASSLATVGNTLIGVISSAGGDAVVAFDVPNLTPAKRWDLSGRWTWGPERVGDLILLATDQEGLMCFAAGHRLLWSSPLQQGPLAGTPTLVDNTLLLSSIGGVVSRLSAETGQEIAKVDLGRPLGASPVVVNSTVASPQRQQDQRLLVAGSEGILYMIDMLNAGS